MSFIPVPSQTFDDITALDDITCNDLIVSTTATFSGATIANLGTVTTADINGGSIDGTAIGATSSSTGRFTTLTVSGTVLGMESFHAVLTSAQTNKTGDSTAYTVICNSEVRDVGNGYNNSTGIFTAPTAGLYVFVGQVYLTSLGVNHTSGVVWIKSSVSAENSTCYIFNPANLRDSGNNCSVSITCVLDMAVNDTAYLVADIRNSTKTVGVFGAGTYTATSFSGFRCR